MELQFEGQKVDEEVILILKRHRLTLLRPVVILAVLWGLWVFLFSKYQASWVTSYPLFVILGVSIYESVVHWFLYSSNLAIVTDQRVIDVDQKSLFHRTVSEATLDKIQDATVEVKGVLPTMFNYGTVHVQTAGAQEVLDLDWIPDPFTVQQRILNLTKKSERKEPPKPETPERKTRFVLR
jgi:hypothetical protein